MIILLLKVVGPTGACVCLIFMTKVVVILLENSGPYAIIFIIMRVYYFRIFPSFLMGNLLVKQNTLTLVDTLSTDVTNTGIDSLTK